MRYFALTLAATLALAANLPAAFADETTTTTTTVQTTSLGTTTGYVLPTGGTYLVVDPNTGLSGLYDYNSHLFAGHPLASGNYVVDQSTGKVIATVDSTGNFIAFTSVPATIPNHFVVLNGNFMYFASPYDMRRAQLDAEIQANYNAGRLSNGQVKDLREKLAEVSSLEAKRRDDGTYSSSTARSIEKKLAWVQGELARNIAEISNKRAKIGLKVE
ncbi:MAG TPA: hypothetical protein V6C81_22280 [Planktothrix sp.]